MPEQTPAWVTATPKEAENGYELHMWRSDGEVCEEIDLNREEYIWVKMRLAEFRGYDVQDDSDIPKSANEGSLELTAERLEEIDKGNRELLDAAYHALSTYEGFTTPVEDFIHAVLVKYKVLHVDEGNRRITPEELEVIMEEFRENFELVTKAARKAARDYPDLVKT